MTKRDIVPEDMKYHRCVDIPHRSRSSMGAISEKCLVYTNEDRIVVVNVDNSVIVHNHTCQGLVKVSTTGNMIYALCTAKSKQVVKVYRSDMQFDKEISLPLTGNWTHISASKSFISAVNEDSSLIRILDHQGNHQFGKVSQFLSHHLNTCR